MQTEIQNLYVSYKNKKLFHGVDFKIVDHELVFKKMINRRYLKVSWEIVNEQ